MPQTLDNVKAAQDAVARLKDENSRMREASGSVTGDRLTCFLYLLARDHLPSGVIEKLANISAEHESHDFTNGWLAQWAKDAAARLLGNPTCTIGSSVQQESDEQVITSPHPYGSYFARANRERENGASSSARHEAPPQWRLDWTDKRYGSIADIPEPNLLGTLTVVRLSSESWRWFRDCIRPDENDYKSRDAAKHAAELWCVKYGYLAPNHEGT